MDGSHALYVAAILLVAIYLPLCIGLVGSGRASQCDTHDQVTGTIVAVEIDEESVISTPVKRQRPSIADSDTPTVNIRIVITSAR